MRSSPIIGSSTQILDLRAACAVFGPSTLPVVVEGETGTGKSLVAAELHALSRRSMYPLIRISAADLVPELIQSILAGSLKGGFTDSIDRAGLLDCQTPFTVWVDDIQDLVMRSQPYLLDAVEGKPLWAVGSTRTFIPDARWIIGTQTPLAELVRRKRMKPDLAARFGFARLKVQPLREHLEDIPLLAPNLLGAIATREKMGPSRVDPSALSALLKYGWPGNVRDLYSALHYAHAVALAEEADSVRVPHLPPEVRDARRRARVRLAEPEIRKHLEDADWVVAHAAASAGISPRHMFREMKQRGISRQSAPGQSARRATQG